MARVLTSHKVFGLNDRLCVVAMDEPGCGHASHVYEITSDEVVEVDSGDPETPEHEFKVSCNIRFQDGPVAENGINGISNEALLAVVEDRLIGFQSGPFMCRENALALTAVQEAMMWLQKRTRDRLSRGVEGTSNV